MLKKLTYPLLFLLSMTVCFQACKKADEALDKITEEKSTPNGFLDEVKSWYDSRKLATEAKTGKIPDRTFEAPIWEIATSIDEKVITTSVKDYTLKNIGYAKYHFSKDAKGDIHGSVFEILYKPSYWTRKVREAQDNGRLAYPVKQDFTGVILQYDLEGNFIAGRSYKNGKILSGIVPKQPIAAKTSRTATDPDGEGDSDIDEGDTPDEGDGSGWVIDLPGVDITPDPSEPPPGWTPSDPWVPENPYPPGTEPEDNIPGGDSGAGSGTVTTTTVTTSIDVEDATTTVNPSGFEFGANVKSFNGQIISVTDYWARPKRPIISYPDNGRTVTRKTQVMDLHGSCGALPSTATLVRWDYIANYTYSYVPYAVPVTRQESGYAIKYAYAK